MTPKHEFVNGGGHPEEREDAVVLADYRATGGYRFIATPEFLEGLQIMAQVEEQEPGVLVAQLIAELSSRLAVPPGSDATIQFGPIVREEG